MYNKHLSYIENRTIKAKRALLDAFDLAPRKKNCTNRANRFLKSFQRDKAKY
jgi:hypothetical protein